METISADPLFVNAAVNDFHLQATSPAVDAGTNSAPNLPQTDVSGNPRILGGNNEMNTCSAASLLGGASCVFNVTFTPTATGARNGALTVSGSDGITPRTPTVALSGFGGDFSISTTPTAATVKHGQSVNFGVTVKPVGTAYNTAVVLSCSGLPSGASCNFSPSNVTPGQGGAMSVLTVSILDKTPRGNYNVLVVGTSGSDSHSTTVLLSVI